MNPVAAIRIKHKPKIVAPKIRCRGSGVYLFKKKGKVVYVGQSHFVPVRVTVHLVKDYDEIQIIWTEGRSTLEDRLIAKYQPIYNKYLKGPKYVLRSAYMRKLNRIKVGATLFFPETTHEIIDFAIGPLHSKQFYHYKQGNGRGVVRTK